MDASEIKVGRVYAAAKPAAVGVTFFDSGLLNDRQVKWMNSDRTLLQYDGPAVKNGRRYPTIRVEKFAAWAAKDITDEMPADEWRPATGNDHG